MSPDLRIRGVDDQTHARLVARASANGRSIEGELRVLLADALIDGSGIGADAWERAGFVEPVEIVPGRLYEVVADWRHFRIAITRAIGQSSTKWNSSIDELVEIERDVDGHVRRDRVWTNPLGIPDRRLGDTAELALRDAMHWLSDYAGVNAMGRERNGSQEVATRHPGLVQVVESVGKRSRSDCYLAGSGDCQHRAGKLQLSV